MKRMSDLEYLRLNKIQKFFYKLACFFMAIPTWFVNLGKKIWGLIKKVGIGIKNLFVGIVTTFTKGTWKTKVSYVIMGFGNLARGQIFRGLLFLVFEAVFIFYMVMYGGYWLSKFDNLGDVSVIEVYDPVLDTFYKVPGDDSFKILLYGLLTILFIIAFIVTWYMNIQQNRIADEIIRSGKKLKSGKQDLQSLVDDQFHKTLLALPLTGITLFTVLPIIFMILVAFTNYGGQIDGVQNLFTWVGLDNFNELLNWDGGTGNLQTAFGEILAWTLMWAFFATFTNYFLGMFVAIMINKKGIRFKKLWRTILVLTIAIPQFISLMYVAKMFAKNGIVNSFLNKLGVVKYGEFIEFWTNDSIARVMVILINIWIGIPYLMLISTGVLMNIPSDLYESSKIDGANVWQQYTKITLPYMLFVTGPYLLTSFIGNINNFNVIYLLASNGGVNSNPDLLTSGGSASSLDLLITWLFNITTGATNNYKLASVIGIMIFAVVAILSLIVYNVMPSIKNEEDFQ